MKVLVIGDSAKDFFISVESHRLSPEVPVPAVIPHSVSTNPGMAANVLANIKSLKPDLWVNTLFPPQPSIKTRYVDRKTNHHFLRVDQDAQSEPMSEADFLRSVKLTPDVIVLSDYNKGFLTKEKMEYVTKYAMEAGIPTFADTKLLLGTWSRFITYVKINNVEMEAQLKAGIEPWKECQNLIVTKGDDGADLYNPNGLVEYHVDSVSQEVVDTAGCGDVFLAGLVVRYLETNDINQSMDFAIRASAIAVSKRGVVTVKRSEVTLSSG